MVRRSPERVRRVAGASRRLTVATGVALLALAASLGSPAHAEAATASFPAAADAYVDASAPKRKFGTANVLLAGSAPVQRSYLRFDVSGVSGPVTRATLRLQATSASIAGYQVRGVVSNTWQERTITYTDAPAFGSVAVASSGPFSAGPTFAMISRSRLRKRRAGRTRSFAYRASRSATIAADPVPKREVMPRVVLTAAVAGRRVINRASSV